MTRPTAQRSDNVRLAVGAIVVAVLGLSLGDAVIKLVSVSFPLWQIYVLRSLLALPVLIAVIKLRGPDRSLVPRSFAWTALRSLLLAVMWVAYYAALPKIQLSVAAAAYYTSPLFITLFAGLFIGDKVGAKGWFAIALGFVGVLLVVRPDADGVDLYAVLPIVAAILYALAMILTRTKCAHESPLVLSAALNVAFVVVGAGASLCLAIFAPAPALVADNPFLLGAWISLGTVEWLALGALAVAIIIGSLGAAIAYQAGPPAVVATFDYFYLAFSVLWGVLVFSEFPQALTLLGIALIAGAGLMAVRR